MEPVFWMGGIKASGLVEVRQDLAALAEPGFWVIVATFEGALTLARFESVVRDAHWDLSGEPLVVEGWDTSHDRAQYLDYVDEIRNLIASGEVYQVNACRVLSATIRSGDGLSDLMGRILTNNPAPWASYIRLPGIEIASASPERFISLRDGLIISSPIKGTSATPKFLAKDEAENLMIVDLIRNDIGKIAETGSVITPRLLATEEHPGIYHLVSDVSARVRKELGFGEVLASLLPPGSVSGAPKSSALKIIAKNEGERGPYCGALGWFEGGAADLAVGIRTFWSNAGRLHFGTGAGITWASDPAGEWEETELKARRLISLVDQVGK